MPSREQQEIDFLEVTVPKLEEVQETFLHYRQTVGGAIFRFVQLLVVVSAPRVTGYMIDMPVPDIRQYMQDYDVFVQHVSEANNIIEQTTVIA